MPAKKVQVEVSQGPGFRTECRAGKHVIVIDQPTAAGGTDAGATPLDVQLVALGGCVAAIGRIIANQRRLAVRAIHVSVEGDIDTDGLLGKPSSNRVGFSAIRVQVRLDSDLTPEEQERFVHEVDERCPVSDNLKGPTVVQIALAP